MSYIQSTVDKSPFCTVSISGSNTASASGIWKSTTVFDTPNQNWAVYDTSGKDIDTSIDTLAFSAFSPDNTTLSGFFVFRDNPTTEQYLMAQIIAESSASSAGGAERGDDVSIRVASTHLPQYSYISGAAETPDTTRSVMYMMTIGE